MAFSNWRLCASAPSVGYGYWWVREDIGTLGHWQLSLYAWNPVFTDPPLLIDYWLKSDAVHFPAGETVGPD